MKFFGDIDVMKGLIVLSFIHVRKNVDCFMNKPQIKRFTTKNVDLGGQHKVRGDGKFQKNMIGENHEYITDDFGAVNGINGAFAPSEKAQDVKVGRIGNRVLNPSQILLPSIFPYYEKYDDKVKYSTSSAVDDGSVDAIPLQRALDEMERAMEKIVDFKSEIDHNGNIINDFIDEIEFTLGSSPKDVTGTMNRIFNICKDNNAGPAQSPIERDENFFTIRIEQPLSHPVDPLCWLHANVQKAPAPIEGRGRNDVDPVMMYLADAESTVEAGVYGSSFTIRNLIAEDSDEDKSQKKTWDIIRNLPEGCRIYGGSRFDKKLQLDKRDSDWNIFGNETWVLPAIEVRQVANDEEGNEVEKEIDIKFSETTLSINLHFTSVPSLIESAENVLKLLNMVSYRISPPVPYTTLPPILSRGYKNDAQEDFERAVDSALGIFNDDTDRISAPFQKVVLARRNDLKFATEVSGLDLMMKLKFGGNIGGHLFYMNPGLSFGKEFLGCAPERLFRVRGYNKMVISEALAGTRPRGSTSREDKELLDDLMYSDKDRNENSITGDFIKGAFEDLKEKGWIESNESESEESTHVEGTYFVRRLQHLQHICQSFEGRMKHEQYSVDITNFLLNKLHPTPAVCGSPSLTALDFIRDYEIPSFDRGFYAGPFGYIGRDVSDIIVAIRSGLLSRNEDELNSSKLSIFAGAGVVPGSTVQGEWSEIGYKLGVLSSFFSQSPITLKSFATPNEAWATAFVEELIRCGVSQFYICPGSRSTPLTTALSRAMRMHVGVIDCISVHDERAAAFRAVGYGRATSRPAAVVTSSGTAVANLYPAVVEASMDGIPLLLLTADRPYENRDIGANQSIDQLKVFSDSYIRWFRDISPPCDDIPVSLALSDANHAVNVAKDMIGPVHLNIQFRENLAPESGPIRGDNRIESITSFSNNRFIDAPGFNRWSNSGRKWTNTYASDSICDNMLRDVMDLINQSKRGIIVVGNLRGTDAIGGTSHSRIISATISEFATYIGYPIFAGAQSADLRFRSSAVVPFAEHLLKHPTVKANMKPDLIIQIGSSLISTEIQDLIQTSSQTDIRFTHVLLHAHKPAERHDPSGTVTHKISADPTSFLPRLRAYLDERGFSNKTVNSNLAPLVHIGRELSRHIPSIIQQASANVREANRRVWNEPSNDDQTTLSEPQIMLTLCDILSHTKCESQIDLFLSNSMPVRDAEFFLYPSFDYFDSDGNIHNHCLGSVAVNRGASGIDGIISSATGHTEATSTPTTLLIGDLATLHDLNAFHHISDKKGPLPLTTIVINNDGGGIFSFLPIAKFGDEVKFEDFFGTPTKSFSFSEGAKAFGLPIQQASSPEEFSDAYRTSLASALPTVIEAKVVGREENVQIHREINKLISNTVENMFKTEDTFKSWDNHSTLPAKLYSSDEIHQQISLQKEYSNADTEVKTLVLLHGWMGDKDEWDKVASSLMHTLPSTWKIISLDLPGHGDTALFNSPTNILQNILKLDTSNDEVKVTPISIDFMAETVLKSLSQDHSVERIDAIAGYSLGGRIALSMRKMTCDNSVDSQLITDDTHLILLGSSPGEFEMDHNPTHVNVALSERKMKDDMLAREMCNIHMKSFLSSENKLVAKKNWVNFLQKWYENTSLWANLHQRKRGFYQQMIQRRLQVLSKRAPDLAEVLEMCSPARNSVDDWKFISPEFTLFMAGELDTKYASIGRKWTNLEPSLKYQEIKNAGHALLIEAPDQVSECIYKALTNSTESTSIRSDTTRTKESTKTRMERVITTTQIKPAILDMEHFVIAMSDGTSGMDLKGIGWGDEVKNMEQVSEREGYIISISSHDGRFVGIGEVSPFNGVHSETIEDVKSQLEFIRDALSSAVIPDMECERILSLDGSMNIYINTFIQSLSSAQIQLHSSIVSGLEMAFMSLASEATKLPLPRSLMVHLPFSTKENLLSINGLITRGENMKTNVGDNLNTPISYPSIKIKVGHRDPITDAQHVMSTQKSNGETSVRADANRSWDVSAAIAFGKELSASISIEQLEFVEEPLQKQFSLEKEWDLSTQVAALEEWHKETGIQYALDESVADVVIMSMESSFEEISELIRSSLANATGCAAIVLKPTLLGMELSLRLGRMAHEDLGIGAVFTSTFESGVGLAFTSFIAFASDSFIKKDERQRKQYPHGISTFSFLNGDALSPPFESYVTKDGKIKIASLGRAIYGLSLDEVRDYFFTIEEVKFDRYSSMLENKSFQATTFTSESGREISIQASLPLPFSDDAACSRFTDLPQQPRWSPWLKSVSYLENGETQWTLNVRGVEFRWKALSRILDSPKGIMWESISGVKNKGRVEFTKVSENSCLMTVKMSLITPRLIPLVFKQTSGGVVKEFVQNKLFKWSMESFRDVVKADLALEKGEVELGDALYGAVEGRSNAIEATLSRINDLKSYE